MKTTTKALLATTIAVATVAAMACSSGGGKGSGTPTPTPTPGPKESYTLNGTGFTGPGGPFKSAGFRVLEGTTVVFCTTGSNVIAGGGTFTFTATSAIQVGLSYHGEAFISKNATASYSSAADLSFYDPAVGTTAGTTFVATTAGRTWAITKTPTQPITWPSGTTCP